MNKVTCPLLKTNMVKGLERKDDNGRTATQRTFELGDIIMTSCPHNRVN